MDFAQKGDRVFDVGFGRGYLAAQLIRERGVEGYHGIDIVDTWVEDAHLLLEANGLAGADIVLRQGDLFDLERADVEATGADLVICCEVLEHADDAEQALRVLADALPDGADLLFSVPLHGRLEQVWGHASVFDVARLKQMLDGAGLYAHHVEPLANTWSLVVASRDPGGSQRVRDASRRPAVRSSVPLVRERRFVDVGHDDISTLATTGGTSELGEPDGRHVTCSVTSAGGLRFPVRGLESLRLALVFTACDDVRRFDVIARSGDDQVASWSWKPGARHQASGRRRVWFRPGEASVGFVPGPYGSMLDVDSVEVVARLPEGGTATFGLAAAYLP
jgi:SAM-dependent methyltransferase